MRIVVTIFAFILAMEGPVLAHAYLDHASPRVGNTVAQSPKEIMLWFSEKVEPAFSTVEVRNEQGALVSSGKATAVGGTQLRVPVKTLPPGTYKVNWRVLSVDTHRTESSFTFRVGTHQLRFGNF